MPGAVPSHHHGVSPARFCSHCGTRLRERRVEGKLRPACPACGRVVYPDPKVAVATVVTRADHLLLVQRRHAPGVGRWVLPGGFLDAGEDPPDVARREVQEETGLVISVGTLLDVVRNPAAEGGASLLILYEGRELGGALRAADDATAAAFFPLDELPPLAFRSTRYAVERLRTRSG